MTAKVFRDSVEAQLVPKFVRLEPGNLIVAPFELMKQLPARFILEQAAEEGKLHVGSLVAETTSGTFGLALAREARLRGYRLILVSDPVIDKQFKGILEDLGAEVVIVDQPSGSGGYQQARLDKLQEILDQEGAFCPLQYANICNPRAYAPFCGALLEAIGEFHRLVGPVGSGGSTVGSSTYLRTLLPNLKVVGVDTFGSVLFGQPDEKRQLRGLGNSLMPKNLRHQVFDDVHWISAPAAFRATRVLHHDTTLFRGPTSGAAYLVGKYYAEHWPDEITVVIMPDPGFRYIGNVYNDDWLRANDAWMEELPELPIEAKHPLDAIPPWSIINWDRRSYDEVMNTSRA